MERRPKGQRTERWASLARPLVGISNSAHVAFGEDFFNAEDAKVGAESRRESFSLATLSEALGDLGVKSGCLPLCLRLRRAMPLRLAPPDNQPSKHGTICFTCILKLTNQLTKLLIYETNHSCTHCHRSLHERLP